MGRILTAVGAFFLTLQAWAYSITGRIMADNSPVGNVVVHVFDSEDKEIGNATTDSDGYFLVSDLEAENITVEINDGAYASVRIEVTADNNDINLGNITLEETVELTELTVTGRSRVITPGKTIVFASKTDKERAAGTFNMLTILAYKAPQIEVRESERTLTVAGKEPEVLVNGIKRPMSFISSIRPDAIERIEFSTSPDIRFGKCYINIITSRAPEGAWLMADVKAAVTTPRNFLSAVAQYSKGKNAFMLYYTGAYRHGRREYIDEEEHYTGGGKDITLRVDGEPSSTLDKSHNVNFYFTRVPSSKSMFEATGGLSIHSNDRLVNDIVTNPTESYKRVNTRGYDQISPYLSLYYHLEASETATVEIDAMGSYNHSRTYRNLSYSTGYESQVNTTSPMWYFSTEALWKQQLPFGWLKSGIAFSRTEAKNRYVIDGIGSKQPLSSTRFKIYSSLSGDLFTVFYNLSAGLNYYKVENGLASPQLMASLQRDLGEDFSISYYFSFDPGMPPASSYTNAVVPVNDLMYHIGADNLKSERDISNQLQFQFSRNKFYASIQGSVNHISNPLITNYWYQSDSNAPLAGFFMEQAANGRNFTSYGFDCSIGASNLWDFLSLSASTGWTHSHLNASESNTVCAWNLNLNMGLYWKGWQLNMTAQDLVPSWSMLGSNQRYRRWPYTSLSLYKKLGKWNLSVSWANMFSRYGGRYRTENLSPVVARTNDYRMNDQGNRVEIGVRYQLVTGKLLSTKNRSVSLSTSSDNGVSWDY